MSARFFHERAIRKKLLPLKLYVILIVEVNSHLKLSFIAHISWTGTVMR